MTFPALTPSTRVFSPGEYPHTAFGTWSLSENRVLHSNVMVRSQLRLSFVGLTESQMLSILTHYQSIQGEYGVFSLPNDIFSGTSSPGTYTLARHFWRYAESPLVEDLPCGSHIVEIVLISATPTIGRANGFIQSVNVSLAAGEYVEAEPRDFPVQFTLSDPVVSIKPAAPIFKAVAYNGSSSAIAITGLGFQPGMIWIKKRTGGAFNHLLFTQLRGADKYWQPSASAAEVTGSNLLTSFDADGFTLLANNSAVSANGSTYVAWCWPDTGSASSNTDGTISTSAAPDATLGLSVFTYTGNGTSGATIGHGLGAIPDLVIIKLLSGNESAVIGSPILGNNQRLGLAGTAASTSSAGFFQSIGSSTVQIGNAATVNGSGSTYIAYAFASVAGKSKIGSYTGLGTTDIDVADPGFTPQYVLLKRYDSTGSWWHIDAARGETQRLLHTSAVEDTISTFTFRPNGFRIDAGSSMNVDGGSYLYMAFA